MPLRLVTRGSALALAQSQRVAARIEALGVRVDVVVRTTRGDAEIDKPLTNLEGKGFFTKELEDALLAGDADVAVHSLKDLPTEFPPGLGLAAVPERADPADILLVRRDAAEPSRPLPVKSGARVGTSSSRRQVQWLARRPDTSAVELRGNVPTRIEKLRRGDCDAILLAKAGLDRLGFDPREFVAKRLDPAVFVCAPGQGALAVEARVHDADLRDLLLRLDDGDARAAAAAERQVLAALGGGCSQPVGAYGRKRGRRFVVDAVTGPGVLEGASLRRARGEGASWAEAVERVLSNLREPDAEIRRTMLGKTVVLTHRAGRGEPIARDLEERGASVLTTALVETKPLEAAADRALDEWRGCAYVALTSVSAVEALFLAGSARARAVLESGAARVCAIGDATAFALEQHGVEVAIRANGTGASALAEAVIADARRRGLAGARVLFPCAEASRPELVNVLVAAGLTVVAVPVYTTHELDAVAAPPLSHPADSVVFFSPSAVRAFARTRPFDARQWIAVGETTRLALVEAGFPSPRAASSPAARHVIEALA